MPACCHCGPLELTATVIILTKNFRQNKVRALVNRALSAIVLAALCVASIGPAQAQAQSLAAQMPTLGDTSDLSSSAERRLGDRIAREIYRDPDYLDDPVLAEYVQGIWQPLLAAARARGDLSPELAERFAWEVMLDRERTVNAFALPGGYLGVNLGLIAVVSNRDELASVLGHELSHVTQRHISRLMAKQGKMAPWMIGAMILGVLAASKSVDAGNALIVGGQAVAAQNQLNFSRDMEREADRVGYGVMTEAGFDAQGFVSMFDKLQQASRLSDNGAYPYLRSHPLTTERIADMQARQALAAPAPAHTAPTLEHAQMAARARVLANADADALRAWQAQADSASLSAQAVPLQAGVWYGAALAASQLRDFAQARVDLVRLRGLVAGDASAMRLAWLLQAEVALRAGDASGAQAALNAVGHTPAVPAALGAPDPASTITRPELLLAAQIALQPGPGGRADLASAALGDSAARLQAWVALKPRDAQAWQLLSSVQSAQHQTLRALRADAEAQVARLDYAAALDRFRAAQAFTRARVSSQTAADHIDASIIDTRQRQVELLLKEQALDR